MLLRKMQIVWKQRRARTVVCNCSQKQGEIEWAHLKVQSIRAQAKTKGRPNFVTTDGQLSWWIGRKRIKFKCAHGMKSS